MGVVSTDSSNWTPIEFSWLPWSFLWLILYLGQFLWTTMSWSHRFVVKHITDYDCKFQGYKYFWNIPSNVPRESPSVKPFDQGASVPFRGQMNWWVPVLLRVLLYLTRTGRRTFVELFYSIFVRFLIEKLQLTVPMISIQPLGYFTPFLNVFTNYSSATEFSERNTKQNT